MRWSSPFGEHAPGPPVFLVTLTLFPMPTNEVAVSLPTRLPLLQVVSPWGIQETVYPDVGLGEMACFFIFFELK